MRRDLPRRSLNSLFFPKALRAHPPLPWVGRGEERGLRLPGEGLAQAAPSR